MKGGEVGSKERAPIYDDETRASIIKDLSTMSLRTLMQAYMFARTHEAAEAKDKNTK